MQISVCQPTRFATNDYCHYQYSETVSLSFNKHNLYLTHTEVHTNSLRPLSTISWSHQWKNRDMVPHSLPTHKRCQLWWLQCLAKLEAQLPGTKPRSLLSLHFSLLSTGSLSLLSLKVLHTHGPSTQVFSHIYLIRPYLRNLCLICFVAPEQKYNWQNTCVGVQGLQVQDKRGHIKVKLVSRRKHKQNTTCWDSFHSHIGASEGSLVHFELSALWLILNPLTVCFSCRFTAPPPTSPARTWRTPPPCCSVLSWCCVTWVSMTTATRSRRPVSTPSETRRWDWRSEGLGFSGRN